MKKLNKNIHQKRKLPENKPFKMMIIKILQMNFLLLINYKYHK